MNDSTPLKHCSKCGVEYPTTLDYFAKRSSAKDGLTNLCKDCISEYNKQFRVNGRQSPVRKNGDLRQCSHCEKWLPATDEYFRKRGDSRDRFRSWCRSCLQADGREYMGNRRQDDAIVQQERANQKAHRSKPDVKARISKQQSEHLKNPVIKQARKRYSHEYEQRPERRLKRRVRSSISRAQRRAAEGFYTKADVELLMRSQKGLCWWCGKPAGDNYEIDHRIAITRGGTNWPNNLCISCFDCNRSKRNKLPHEWNGRLL